MGGAALPAGLGMSGPAESPSGAGERPIYHDRWGPVSHANEAGWRARERTINVLAADQPKNVNGGVEQAGENVRFRQDGVSVCFKNTLSPPRRPQVGQPSGRVPENRLLVQWGAGGSEGSRNPSLGATPWRSQCV